MGSTDKKVSVAVAVAPHLPARPTEDWQLAAAARSEPGCSIAQVERAVSALEGRWKLLIVHHLFVRTPLRFSELERAIPQVTQKMLIQQLRALEEDGVVERIDFQQVPPRVEYRLTLLGQGLESALNALHTWAAALPARTDAPTRQGGK